MSTFHLFIEDPASLARVLQLFLCMPPDLSGRGIGQGRQGRQLRK